MFSSEYLAGVTFAMLRKDYKFDIILTSARK